MREDRSAVGLRARGSDGPLRWCHAPQGVRAGARGLAWTSMEGTSGRPLSRRFHDRRGTAIFGAAPVRPDLRWPAFTRGARDRGVRGSFVSLRRAGATGEQPAAHRTNGPKRIVERGRRKVATCRRREPPDPRERTAATPQRLAGTRKRGCRSFGEVEGWQKSVGRILLEAEMLRASQLGTSSLADAAAAEGDVKRCAGSRARSQHERAMKSRAARNERIRDTTKASWVVRGRFLYRERHRRPWPRG